MYEYLYCITRRGERVAGSLAVPFEAAVVAVSLLNKEYRRKGEFDIAPDPTATTWEEMQAPRFSGLVDNLLGTC